MVLPAAALLFKRAHGWIRKLIQVFSLSGMENWVLLIAVLKSPVFTKRALCSGAFYNQQNKQTEQQTARLFSHTAIHEKNPHMANSTTILINILPDPHLSKDFYELFLFC